MTTKDGSKRLELIRKCHFDLMELRMRALSLWDERSNVNQILEESLSAPGDALLTFCIASATEEIMAPPDAAVRSNTISYTSALFGLRGLYAQRALTILHEASMQSAVLQIDGLNSWLDVD